MYSLCIPDELSMLFYSIFEAHSSSQRQGEEGEKHPALEPHRSNSPVPWANLQQAFQYISQADIFIFFNQEEMFLCKLEWAHMTFTYLFLFTASAEIIDI